MSHYNKCVCGHYKSSHFTEGDCLLFDCSCKQFAEGHLCRFCGQVHGEEVKEEDKDKLDIISTTLVMLQMRAIIAAHLMDPERTMMTVGEANALSILLSETSENMLRRIGEKV